MLLPSSPGSIELYESISNKGIESRDVTAFADMVWGILPSESPLEELETEESANVK